MSTLSLLTQEEYDALRADAEIYRYLKKYAPPEGVVVKFHEGGSSITWGVAFSERDGEELIEALREVLSAKRHDPMRRRSGAGKWVHMNLRTETMARLDAVLAKHTPTVSA